MEKLYYSAERGVQIVLSLLKQHGIKRIIVSPGATNITLVASVQHDSFFELYSCVDERSAAYMACGMAEASGEPVVLSCTGATSSRDYMPGLTEAFYRKLPIIALTSSQDNSKIGNLIPQVTDRTQQPKDLVVESVQIQLIKDDADAWDANLKINKALLALTHHGGGPVHINLMTSYNPLYDKVELTEERLIRRYVTNDKLPQIVKGKVAVFVGSHSAWSKGETDALDAFCQSHNAVVFCDHTSNYRGKYRVLNSLLGCQKDCFFPIFEIDLLIHIGGMSGGYPNIDRLRPKSVWRVCEDGALADHYKKLTAVFEMKEEDFFRYYYSNNEQNENYLLECQRLNEELNSLIPELPFSNAWIAQQTCANFPQDSVVYLGILNTLRVWNIFETPNSVTCYSNVGGFGIDGGISSLVGMSLVNSEKLHYCIIGDLSFFYDMNVLGNRHINSNVRILLINNGRGVEFRLPNNQGSRFGELTDGYIAAARHFGNQSQNIVRHLSEDWGFQYLSASNKNEFLGVKDVFLSKELSNKPIVLEAFIDYNDEVCAHKLLTSIATADTTDKVKSKLRTITRDMLGEKIVNKVKGLLN